MPSQASDWHQTVMHHIKGSRHWAGDQNDDWKEQLAIGERFLEKLGYRGCFSGRNLNMRGIQRLKENTTLLPYQFEHVKLTT